MFSWLGQSWYDGEAKGYPNGLGTLAGGVAFPMGTSAVETMLNGAGADCVDFLAAMKNSTYHQLGAPITYSYTATPVASGTTPTTGNSGTRNGAWSVGVALVIVVLGFLH